MISAVIVYAVQIKVGCDALVGCVDSNGGRIVHNIVSVVNMMSELNGSGVYE